MAQRDVEKTVQQVENAPQSGDGHVHNLDEAYAQILHMQQHEGGPSSEQFRKDMVALNQDLHAKGTIPNLDIVGVDNDHHMITRDRADNRVAMQDAGSVNDFGALGSGSGEREQNAAAIAKAFGIDVSRNPDSSYEVRPPFDNPQTAAAGIINTFLSQLGGGSSDAGSAPGSDATPSAPGLNGWAAQSLRGWGDDSQPADSGSDSSPQYDPDQNP